MKKLTKEAIINLFKQDEYYKDESISIRENPKWAMQYRNQGSYNLNDYRYSIYFNDTYDYSFKNLMEIVDHYGLNK